jgi:pilus assembly protein Flp/PilA
MPNFMITLRQALTARLSPFRRSDEGATAVEYGLMVALIAGVIIAAVTALGGQVRNGFEETCTAIQGASTSTATPSAAPCP